MGFTRSRDPLVIGDRNLQATADGHVIVRVRGDGPAVVAVHAAGPLGSRRLGEQRLSLRPTGTTTVAFQLCADHLAWLRRRRTARVTVTVATAAGTCRRRVDLYAPRVPEFSP